MRAHIVLRKIPDFFATDFKHFAKRFYKKPIIKFAEFKRKKFSHAQFVGITGSSGKTTTKELAHLALSTKYCACKNEDSNNQIYSVARTILSLRKESEVCVQELGISHTEDLTYSVKLLRPSVGVVINIGTEHYRFFRSRDNVAKEKFKLIYGLPSDGVAILNSDDDVIVSMMGSLHCKVFTFGCNQACDLCAINVSSKWPDRLQMTLKYKNEKVECDTQLCGEHLVHCVLAAVAIALVHGIPLSEAVASIKSFQPFIARMMPYKTSSGITFIRDDWKAPYWSIQESIKFIKNARAMRKIIIFGTLSDYGGASGKKYRRVSKSALEVAEHVFFVGENANSALRIGNTPKNKTIKAFTTAKEISDYLKSFLRAGDLVLLKASGGDHLARLALMYDLDVSCWREKCGRSKLCDHCHLLTVA